ncbi:hypothetical protein [Halocatena halophila]|uniref:hypothetical protein n=1 Tax=Halocatena halophila TaxID=2814576 RepID=UPI002ECFB332
MTDFNLLRSRKDGQMFLHIHRGDEMTLLVPITDDERKELIDALEGAPDPVR